MFTAEHGGDACNLIKSECTDNIGLLLLIALARILFFIRSLDLDLLSFIALLLELHELAEDLFNLWCLKHHFHVLEIRSDLGGFNTGAQKLNQVEMLAKGETC
jgi:hypothetical protein